MTDISINSASSENDSKLTKRNDSAFSALQREYDKFKKDMQKSDFANSPTALEKELTLIAKLKKAAEGKGYDSEIENLNKREQEIYTKISNKIVSDSAMPFYKPVSFQGNKRANNIDFNEEKFTSFIEQTFGNSESIKNDVRIMDLAGIDKNAMLKILSALKIKNPQDDTFSVSDESVKNVVQMKRLLAGSRNAEKNEFLNSMQNMDEFDFNDGSHKYIFQDGKLTYSTPIQGEMKAADIREEIEKSNSAKENNLLIEFVQKYTQADGLIDNKALRTFIALRRSGITYENIMAILNECLGTDGEINKEKLSVITDLKKAGVLSKDVTLIADASYDKDKGTYDSAYLEQAKKLSALDANGESIVQLISDANYSEDASDFIQRYLELLDVDSVIELTNIVRNDDGSINSNAIDIVDSVFYNPVMQDENGEIEFSEFLKTAELVLNKVKQISNPKKGISNNATETVFQLCKNATSIEDIFAVLDSCCDERGYINDMLAKIAYHISRYEENADMAIEIVESCKNDNKVDLEKAQETLHLFRG